MLISSASEQKMTVSQPQADNRQSSNFSQTLEKAKSEIMEAPSSPPPANLESVTTQEAYSVLSGLANDGKLTPEEYQNMMPTVYLRMLNAQEGHQQSARFDLLAGVQSLIENSKMIGRNDQVYAQIKGLAVLKAYQAN